MSWLFITDLAEPGDMPDCAARLRAGCMSSRVLSLPRRDEQRHRLADMAHPLPAEECGVAPRAEDLSDGLD